MSAKPSIAAEAEPRNPTADYLASIGINPASALAAPPSIDAIQHRPDAGPSWSGPTEPHLEYFRAVRNNPREVRQLIEEQGFVVEQTGKIALTGCSNSNDLILVRQAAVGVELERKARVRRQQRRAGGVANRYGDDGAEGSFRFRSEQQRNIQMPPGA